MPSLRSKAEAEQISPSTSTIRVSKRKSPSPHEEPLKPVKKLKLTLRRQEVPENTVTEVTDARPKRKSNRPSRYSDQIVEEKPIQKAPTPKKTVSPKTASAKDAPPKAEIVSTAKSITSDEDEEPTRPFDYGMDFLMSYIEDSPIAASTPPAAQPQLAKKPKLLPPPKEKSIVTTRLATTPQAIAPHIHASLESVPVTPQELPRATTVSSGPISQGAFASPNTKPAFSPEESPIVDDAPTIVKKLQTAIHALSGLNVPAPSRPLIADHLPAVKVKSKKAGQ